MKPASRVDGLSHMSDLVRFTVDDVGRVYLDPDGRYYLSVTTILNAKENSPALERWKDKNDGKDGRPHWLDIRTYKQHRGTLVHYHCLNELVKGDMWSPDEASSETWLKTNPDAWSPHLPAWDRYRDDLFWARERAWPMVRRSLGIEDENVIDVECFVRNRDIGYAGQFDLLYRDPETNETVLADIKTSSGVWDKHRLQLTAYSQAVDIEIDRMEVIRIHPDRREWEVVSSHDWPETPVELWAEFLDLVDTIDHEKITAEVRAQSSGDAEEMHD